ncbi:MAG: leucine-rich repeat domain-containing protein [Bacteroidales bacterium]|nr:leucine-rich repeat domain-containing protein [Bacteroidales bacterium]
MKQRTFLLICIVIGCLLVSCSTRPLATSNYYGDYTEEEWRKIVEKSRAEAKAYLEKLEESDPDHVTMINFNFTFVDSCPDFTQYNKVWLVNYSGIEKETIDKSLFSSDSLKHVTLNKCSFRNIDFPEDNHIERLSLTNCQLTRIPSCIRRCKHLKEINLEGNNIRHIPKWITELDSLEEICLNFNQLKLSRRDIRRMSKLKSILLAGNNLERLPKNVGQLHCNNLNLSKNKLHSLPASFAQLTQIKNLIFYENEFEDIPEVLADFKNLKHLDFYKNNIKEIPDFVGDMDNLQQLFLSFNQIEEIPDTLRNLKRLKYFYIHHNELHFLPEWIMEMDSIERFGIGYNHLLELPDLSNMKSLKDFDCEHNLLERFPWELIEKPDMEMIILRDNDFNLSDEEKMRLIKASKTVNIVY